MENVMDVKRTWSTAVVEDGIAIPDSVLPEPFSTQMEKHYGKPMSEILETVRWESTELDWGEPVGAELDARNIEVK